MRTPNRTPIEKLEEFLKLFQFTGLLVKTQVREAAITGGKVSEDRLMKGMPAPPIREYTRLVDRKPAQQEPTGAQQSGTWDDGEYPDMPTDDDVPF